jgi:dTDP-4-amino-4,6-dideoxygalactose transaminase
MRPIGPNENIILPYLVSIREKGIFSNSGPLVKSLESRFSRIFNLDPELVVLCASATQGIQGVAQLSKYSNYVCPAFNFTGSILALTNSGKNISFSDIDSLTWELDSDRFKPNKSTGVLVVLPFGKPPDYDKFKNHDHVIFDAAGSIGNLSLNLEKLKSNWVAVFSLHATKVLGIGEGGIVAFGNRQKAKEFRKYINFGFEGTRISQILGTNIKLSEYSAAVGHAVLDVMNQEFLEWDRSRSLVTTIEQNLKLDSFSRNILGRNPYWIISFPSKKITDKIEKELNFKQIETRRWWGKGLHNWRIFKNVNKLNDLISTDKIATSYLGLPFSRNMSKKESNYIEHELKTLLSSI